MRVADAECRQVLSCRGHNYITEYGRYFRVEGMKELLVKEQQTSWLPFGSSDKKERGGLEHIEELLTTRLKTMAEMM